MKETRQQNKTNEEKCTCYLLKLINRMMLNLRNITTTRTTTPTTTNKKQKVVKEI